MDKFYLTILESCNWDDEIFVEGYKLLMGTITEAKIPLLMQTLHNASLTVRFRGGLLPLGSLLIGLTDSKQLVPSTCPSDIPSPFALSPY
jgi:hypothetical protein